MIQVRIATLRDSTSISNCLFLAMEDIVYKFIGEEDEQKAREFMLHFVESDNNQYSYQNCWVAEDDSKVVGAVILYDGALLAEVRQPIIEYLRTNFKRDFKFEDETQAGEYYIDSLGVDPAHQNMGIGTMLLRFVIDEFVGKRRQTLGLLVDDVNPKAKKLYLRLGFKSAGGKLVFGKKMEHLQIKGV